MNREERLRQARESIEEAVFLARANTWEQGGPHQLW
jgi:hypothetical protein